MAKKPSLDVVIPVYNEEKELEERITTLANFLTDHMSSGYDWHVVIADNASTDRTAQLGKKLAKTLSRVSYVHLDKKGRGRAVKYTWTKSTADFVSYMDLDLSTDLKHFPPLIGALSRGYDMAIGTRNAPTSRVYGRSLLRTITSKGYIALIKLFFFVRFSDAQCGFKAVTRRVVNELVPMVRDNEWFFDTELLVIGEKLGYRIYEEPVTWIDNPGSTVRVYKTAKGDIEGLRRLFMERPWNPR